jgi:pPIWI_RE three-gene island domain Y/REase associating with pPIWI_RE
MTIELASPHDGTRQRQSRVAAACLRAAYAWSERESRPGAMREVARMTGVVMEALGPGSGPASPMQLVACLRRPLSELVTMAGQEHDSTEDAINEAVLLDGDRLADAAYDVACEYAQQLTSAAETAAWLPSWTRMLAEQVENEAFSALVESGDKDAYTRARRLITEFPAGTQEELSAQVIAAGARCPVKYSPLTADQQYMTGSGSWWWPCPACRWPMTVAGDAVRCRYRPHRAAYQAAQRRPGSPPRLLRTGDRVPGSVPQARPAGNAVCVDPGVWRFIVVPGASEIRIAGELEKLGADVRMWPDMDTCDLHVRAGTLDRLLDVKEYRSARRLIEDLRSKVMRAAVLLPKSHEHQAGLIAAALPSITVITETTLRRQVRQAATRRHP